MAERRSYLDIGPGETRAVVTLDGAPERLLIERAYDDPSHVAGARLIARVRRIERGLNTAFLEVGSEPDAVLPLSGVAAGLAEGARVEVAVIAAPRRDKGAVVQLVGPGEGPPRLLTPAPPLAHRLLAFAPGEPLTGAYVRDLADRAEAEALAIVHPLPTGASLAIEVTRAVVAIDVDLGVGGRDAGRGALAANRAAIGEAARLLRLKGLGGPVVIDLVGRGHDGAVLRQAMEAAFAPDQPGVVFGPLTRFGLLALALPRRDAPVAERFCGPDGRPSMDTLALRLLRAIEREAGPGMIVEARAHPEVAARAERLARHLADRIGPRFRLIADPSRALEAEDVRPI